MEWSWTTCDQPGQLDSCLGYYLAECTLMTMASQLMLSKTFWKVSHLTSPPFFMMGLRTDVGEGFSLLWSAWWVIGPGSKRQDAWAVVSLTRPKRHRPKHPLRVCAIFVVQTWWGTHGKIGLRRHQLGCQQSTPFLLLLDSQRFWDCLLMIQSHHHCSATIFFIPGI